MRPGHHRAAARDREHVLDRHQEGLVDRTLRLRDVVVDRFHQLEDRVVAELLVAVFQRRQRRAADDRDVVARELVGRQQLAHFHLHQVQKLFVVDHVALVHEHDQRRHADLARQEDVLAGLRHRAVGRRHHQDRAVHLGGARDHVLHIVGVTGAVDMGVVPLGRLVFDMRRRDRDAARLFFRRLVDLVIGRERRSARLGKHLRDRRRQRRLAVVNVTDRSDVAVRLVPLEFGLRHGPRPSSAAAITNPKTNADTESLPIWQGLERVKGIEPSSSAWKAVALPLSYTRNPIQHFTCHLAGGRRATTARRT